MMAHAAYAALMTGLPCDGPTWKELLDTRDTGSALIQASWHLHELCHFRDPDTHADALDALAASCPEDLRPLFATRPVGPAPVPST